MLECMCVCCNPVTRALGNSSYKEQIFVVRWQLTVFRIIIIIIIIISQFPWYARDTSLLEVWNLVSHPKWITEVNNSEKDILTENKLYDDGEMNIMRRYIICILYQILWGWWTWKGLDGWSMGKIINVYKICVGKLEGNQSVNAKILVNLISKKYGWRMCNRFIWARIGSSSRLMRIWQ
jgi:hypothetical protein